MAAPDASQHHDPDPRRLRKLIAGTGMTYAQAAQRLGCSVRSLERWLSDTGRCPYPEQYLIEVIARHTALVRAKHVASLAREPPPRPAPVVAPAKKPHPFAALIRKGTAHD